MKGCIFLMLIVYVSSISLLLKCGSYLGPQKKVLLRSMEYAKVLQQCCNTHEEEWLAADSRLRHYIGEKVFCQCLNEEVPREALLMYPAACTEAKLLNKKIPKSSRKRRVISHHTAHRPHHTRRT